MLLYALIMDSYMDSYKGRIMQIIKAEVFPIELILRQPVRMAGVAPFSEVTAIFVRAEIRDGRNAWGCGVAHPALTGEKPASALKACREAADMLPDLHPTNLEYSLAELAPLIQNSPAATCAFDLLFHDLLGLIAGIPLYRLLGGYRNRLQTSVTIPLSSVSESVTIAQKWVDQGYRMLKVKGGENPEEDVRRVKAIRRSLPDITIRLDADGGFRSSKPWMWPEPYKRNWKCLNSPWPQALLTICARCRA